MRAIESHVPGSLLEMDLLRKSSIVKILKLLSFVKLHVVSTMVAMIICTVQICRVATKHTLAGQQNVVGF